MDGIELLEFENVFNTLDEYRKEFERLYKENLLKDGRKATGELIKSISTEIKFGGTRIDVVLNVADYYKYVEEGRKKGKFPPVDKILQWIKAKPIKPQKRDGKLPTEKQLAYLIGRKIAREGYKGKPSLISTIKELNEYYLHKLQESLEKDFDLFSIKVLDSINKMVKI